MTPDDPAIEEQLPAGQQFAREYRNTFKAPAKRQCVPVAGQLFVGRSGEKQAPLRLRDWPI